MKNILRFGAMLAVLIVASAGIAKADGGQELSYTLTGPNGFVATWDMSQNPTPLSTTGISFDASVTNFLVNGTAAGNDIVFYSVIPQFPLGQGITDAGFDFIVGGLGSELFSLPLGSPVMNIGDFTNLYGYPSGGILPGSFQLDVAPVTTPEPSSLLLLASGIMGLGMAARRRFAR
jgi:PEP-CTERM motif